MDKIYAKLFGVPQIYKNDEKVFFPYAKINALIYYILINGVTSRDEIAGLLWPDENEKIAKKNLRNALYQAKKCLNMDFILSPNKSILTINEDMDIKSDVALFLDDPTKNLHLYDGDFLQGFFLKEAESYEYWITKMRNFYQDKFVNISYTKIEQDIEDGNYENVEKDIGKLTKIDEFDERNFRLLMKFYKSTGRNGKVIETYFDLSKLLQNELGVEPDKETKKIYEDSIKEINLNSGKVKPIQSFFYGRYEEIAKLENTLNLFKNNEDFKSVLIKGEAGIGKTALKKKVLEDRNEFLILESYCYQAEQNYALRSFGIIIKKLNKALKEENLQIPALLKTTMATLFPSTEDRLREKILFETNTPLKFDLLTQVVVDSIKELSRLKKLIIVFEDIQWMDQTSLKILTSVMLNLKNECLFIITSRNQYSIELDDFETTLLKYEKIEKLEIERFDREEAQKFMLKSLPKKNLDEKTLNKIYEESEGNPFFLGEYVATIKSNNKIDIMTTKMIDTIKSRLLYLSKTERALLDIISFFYDEAPIDVISEITDQSEFEIIGLIEELERRNILTEVEHKNGISIVFTHTKLREYTYMVQPNSKKKIIHKKIGDILESKLNNQKKKHPYLYSKLVYHYTCAGEKERAIKYKIETLNYYLNFSHELFPILNSQELEKQEKVYISRDNIQDMFSKLSENFEELKNSSNNQEINKLEIEFFYMKGRYLIRDGKYEEGLDDIQYVIHKATEINELDYVLDGYKQIIFYNIQINNAKNMIEYIEIALNLAVKLNYHKEIGILLRLKGLYNMMVGNNFIAEKLLEESINTLKVTKEVENRYSINIAASYSYIGEIRFEEGNFKEAETMFKKSIELSLGKNALSSLSIFYIGAGKALFAQKKYDDALNYFNLAYDLYGQFDWFWKRPVLDSYMALTEIMKKSYDNALIHILSARDYSEKLQDPRDLGTLYFVHYIISKLSKENREIKEKFEKILTKSQEEYKNAALDKLDPYRDAFEIQKLNEK